MLNQTHCLPAFLCLILPTNLVVLVFVATPPPDCAASVSSFPPHLSTFSPRSNGSQLPPFGDELILFSGMELSKSQPICTKLFAEKVN